MGSEWAKEDVRLAEEVTRELAETCAGCSLAYQRREARFALKSAGETLYFSIAHEDWGEINPPTFGRQIAARVVQNEMIAAIVGTNVTIDPRNPPAWPAGRPFTLVGPIGPEGTRGNSSEGVDVWGPGTGSATKAPPGRTPIGPVNPGR